MYKTISSIISWVSHKTRKRSAFNEDEECEGGLGAPYSTRKWMDDYYRPDKEKKGIGSEH